MSHTWEHVEGRRNRNSLRWPFTPSFSVCVIKWMKKEADAQEKYRSELGAGSFRVSTTRGNHRFWCIPSKTPGLFLVCIMFGRYSMVYHASLLSWFIAVIWKIRVDDTFSFFWVSLWCHVLGGATSTSSLQWWFFGKNITPAKSGSFLAWLINGWPKKIAWKHHFLEKVPKCAWNGRPVCHPQQTRQNRPWLSPQLPLSGARFGDHFYHDE